MAKSEKVDLNEVAELYSDAIDRITEIAAQYNLAVNIVSVHDVLASLGEENPSEEQIDSVLYSAHWSTYGESESWVDWFDGLEV